MTSGGVLRATGEAVVISLEQDGKTRRAHYPQAVAKVTEMEELKKEIASLSPVTRPEFSNDPYRLKQSIFPILMPYDAADFENVSFYGDGSVTNWI